VKPLSLSTFQRYAVLSKYNLISPHMIKLNSINLIKKNKPQLLCLHVTHYFSTKSNVKREKISITVYVVLHYLMKANAT
jgi:hypothetical protein